MEAVYAPPQASFVAVPLERIKPSPHQARTQFDPEAIQSLAESMKQEGQLQPVVVRQLDDAFELISGERRVRAAQLLGWGTVEAKILETVSDAEAAAKGLVENLQRENLNPIDEARGFKELKDLNDSHWTQDRIGQVCGKKQDYVSRSLALLNLPEPVLQLMRQRMLTREHGIELLRFNDVKLQKKMARKIVKGEWSVKKTRTVISEAIARASGTPVKAKPADPLEDLWLNLLNDAGIAPRGTWDVNYGAFKIRGRAKTDILGWNFFVAAPKAFHKSELVSWFRKIARALESAPVSVKAGEPAHLSDRTTKRNPRLPENDQEEVELRTRAELGPGAVYAWIWGPDSLMARTMARMSWKDIGATDPISGYRNVVDVLRQMQSF